MTPKGQYIENSSYYIGIIMPSREKRFYACEGDYLEDYEYELEKEKNRKKSKGKDGEE